ncbi:DUF7124 domain-containing protein [Halorarius halobius]|uniref:DUF7124 domain-containing protein n=1 Tax=Halorarius halobius TaxID=2962671 RepID=UPI0020CCE3F3|nr:hypothetical protein [Halorarius halobius]
MDDVRLTLAFDLAALRRLSDPARVVADAKQWSEHVGVVTDRPPHVLTKFTREHAIDHALAPEPAPAVESLEHAREHFETGRYVHVGTREEHEGRAERVGWEYLEIAEAAELAGWGLETPDEADDANRMETSTDDWP